MERPAPDQVRGYSAVGGEGLSYSLDKPAPPDLKESLSIGPVVVPDDPYYGDDRRRTAFCGERLAVQPR